MRGDAREGWFAAFRPGGDEGAGSQGPQQAANNWQPSESRVSRTNVTPIRPYLGFTETFTANP